MPDSSFKFDAVVHKQHAPILAEIVKTPFFIETMMNSFQGFAGCGFRSVEESSIFIGFVHVDSNACTKIISVKLS